MKTTANTGLAALCLAAGTAWSAPITFNTALPVREGGWVLREQFVLMKNADDSTPAGRDMEVTGLVSVLGSGSWDALGGAVLTYQTLDFQIDSQVSYKANREANGFRAGNVLQIDGSLQYRLWPRSLGAGVPAFLYGVLEANLVHAAKDRANGSADPNSGGTTQFITPGLQYVTRKWIVEAGVQVPVSQDLNGSALGNDHVFTTGFRLNF